MRFRRMVVFVLALTVSVCGFARAEEDAGETAPAQLSLWSGSDAGADFDGYIVKLRDDTVMPYAASRNATALGENLYAVESEEEAYALAGPGAVESIEPNYRVEMYAGNTLYYNDPYYSQSLWHLKEAGLGMEDAWKWQDDVIISNGLAGQDIKVAVLDSGFFRHNDFDYDRVLTGINATTDGGDSSDMNGHGTMVSGIIAAKANNGIGVVGVSHGVTLLPIRVFDKDGHGYVTYIISGIQSAIDNNVDIINMSLGTPSYSKALKDIVQKALDAGIIVVAAVGNKGTAELNYPAAYDGVVGVGALDPDGTVADYSQKNASVWIAAPGSQITSTYSGANRYATGDGTSFAAPCVAGLAAIAKQYAKEHGQSLTPEEFSTLLRLAGGHEIPDYSYGYGSVTAGGILALMGERQIRYELDGGTLPADCVSAYIPYSSDVITLPTPARDNYFFAGWYTDSACTGSPVTSLVPTELTEPPVYYARWIENLTELSAITLNDWVAENIGNKEWKVYLPSGTPMPAGTDCVRAFFAYSGSQSDLGYQVTDHGDGQWTIAVTQNTSNSAFEDSYTLIADNTTYPAPSLAAGREPTVAGIANPASLSGKTGAVAYTENVASWFSNATFFALSNFAVNGERVEMVVGLEISPTGALRYVPPAAAEKQTVSFDVVASNDRFSGACVSVTIRVGEIPLSVPSLSAYTGEYDASTLGSFTVGFTAYQNTLSSLSDSRGNTLNKDTDYTVQTGQQIIGGEVKPSEEVSLPASVTLSGDYLTKLDNGEVEITFHFSTGRDSQPTIDAEPFVLTVTNSSTHSYTAVTTKAATCTQPGIRTYVCANCNSQETEEIPALGHEYGEWSVDKEASCTETGESSRTCSRCGFETQVVTVEALGHDYGKGEVTRAASCTEDGERTYTCSRCGDRQTETVPALEHSYDEAGVITKTATCTDPGEIVHTCANCGDKRVREIPALGGSHKYGEWAVTKAPTCTETGERFRSCSLCGGTQTETVSALGHTYQKGVCIRCQTVDPSQSGGGLSSGSSSGGSSSGNPSSGGSSGGRIPSTKEPTVSPASSNTVTREENGVVITTVTDPIAGTVTETTEYPDGSSLTVETQSDGTVTTTRQDSIAIVTTVRAPGKSPTAAIALPDDSDGVAVNVPVGRDSGRWIARDVETDRVLPLCLAVGEDMLIWTDHSVRVVLEEPAPRSYSDITQNQWWSDAVDFVSSRELFVGMREGIFAPQEYAVRAQVLTVFSRLAGQELATTGAAWYEGVVSWAIEAGLSDGSRPGDRITREEMVALIWRWAGCPEAEGSLAFADAADISIWATQAVAWGVEKGLVQGRTVDSFLPGDYTTRAEAAIFFQRTISYLLRTGSGSQISPGP